MVGFFEEKEGVKSSIRLNSFVALLSGIGYVFFATYTNQLDANSLAVFFGLLVGGFAPKVVQKYAESK